MKVLLLGFCSLLCITCVAQTKRIAFKSHSGSVENFSIALENNLFDMENSNFGNPPIRELDSVILISDSVAVLISHREIDLELKRPRTKDTLRNHPLFLQKAPLDSIKNGLKRAFWFDNSVDSVKFIGFGAKETTGKKKNSIPVIGINKNGNQGPFDGQAFLIIGLIFLLSVAAGLFSWKYKTAQFS